MVLYSAFLYLDMLHCIAFYIKKIYYDKAPYEAIKQSAVYHKYEVKSQKSGMSYQKQVPAFAKQPVWLREGRSFKIFFYLLFHRHLKFSSGMTCDPAQSPSFLAIKRNGDYDEKFWIKIIN